MNRGLKEIRVGRAVLNLESVNRSGLPSPLNSINEYHTVGLCNEVNQAKPVSTSFYDLNLRRHIKFHHPLGYVDAYSLITEEEVPDPQNQDVLIWTS